MPPGGLWGLVDGKRGCRAELCDRIGGVFVREKDLLPVPGTSHALQPMCDTFAARPALGALFFLASMLSAGAVPAQPAAPAAAAEAPTGGFTPLFDGKTLAGWTNPYSYGKVDVVNGEIHLTAEKKFFLCTEKSYANFVFEGDVHLPEGPANSGFMFRARVKPNSVTGYQAEVDSDANRMWSGGLYDEGLRMWFISPKKDDPASVAAFKERSAGAFQRHGWNTYRITCDGPKIKIEVNGVTTTDITDDRDASGPIAIQHHGEKGATYHFRNLRIKELK